MGSNSYNFSDNCCADYYVFLSRILDLDCRIDIGFDKIVGLYLSVQGNTCSWFWRTISYCYIYFKCTGGCSCIMVVSAKNEIVHGFCMYSPFYPFDLLLGVQWDLSNILQLVVFKSRVIKYNVRLRGISLYENRIASNTLKYEQSEDSLMRYKWDAYNICEIKKLIKKHK